MNNFKLIPTYNRWFENKDKTNDKIDKTNITLSSNKIC